MEESNPGTLYECDKCEDLIEGLPFECSCGSQFCESCLTKHITQMATRRKQYDHKRKEPSLADILWEQVKKEYTEAEFECAFREDEKAKWFGVQSQELEEGTESGTTERGCQYILETSRLRDLLTKSLTLTSDSPVTQFPSITSFVGGTGSGKSLLIRYLIGLGGMENAGSDGLKKLEQPVCGHPEYTGILPTTGEVNLYAEPSTFGTANPMLLVDCEGIGGSAPISNQHQSKWYDPKKYGRKIFHFVNHTAGERSRVLEDIYPRLLYILSDVVCYVSKDNHWTKTIERLVEWSTTGAQHTVNHAALPALILIMNNWGAGRKGWTSDNGSVTLTQYFFEAMRSLFNDSSYLKDMAQKYGISLNNSSTEENRPSPIEQLLLKSYSSVHVHYIPQMGMGSLGTSDLIYEQMVILKKTIKSESERVQEVRIKSRTKFNSNQLISVAGYAFSHICEYPKIPFDFGLCRLLTDISVPAHIATFLKICIGNCGKHLGDKASELFEATTNFLASAIVKDAQSKTSQAVIGLHVSSGSTKAICLAAIEDYFENHIECSYVYEGPLGSSWSCSNTKSGHTKGHESKLGSGSAAGDFEYDRAGVYNAESLITSIEAKTDDLIRAAENTGSDPDRWRTYFENEHKSHLGVLRLLGAYPSGGSDDYRSPLETLEPILNPGKYILNTVLKFIEDMPFIAAEFCFCCLFKKSEYRLPCQHLVCGDCLREGAQRKKLTESYAKIIVGECMLCGRGESKGQGKSWPFVIQILPDLTNPRILALDGAGARSITQLVLLERIETLIGLGLPIGRFFDLIIGSSSGGIAALGLGTQGLRASDYFKRFKTMLEKCFVNKLGTKTLGLQWISRWFRQSIYLSENYETAVKELFEGSPPFTMSGLQGYCRVAVTTTVELGCHLIANYRFGSDSKYIESTIPIWSAARCTSAAPLYLEPVLRDGLEFRDGGLTANNPIQLAIDEARVLWGDTRPDLVLSIGTGFSSRPQPIPTGPVFGDQEIAGLFKAWLTNMNGDQAWNKFYDSERTDVNTLTRCNRLNVKFKNEIEPGFDDVEGIKGMEYDAKQYDEDYVQRTDSLFGPISGPCNISILKIQADILKASLYFFHLLHITKDEQNGVFVVNGTLKCRLDPSEITPFGKLLDATSHFVVNGRVFHMDQQQTPRQLFDMPIIFEYVPGSGPIRIDVNFREPYSIAISGFPMDMRVLRDYYKENYNEEKALQLDADADGELADADGELADVGTSNNRPQQATSSNGDDLTADSFEIITATP